MRIILRLIFFATSVSFLNAQDYSLSSIPFSIDGQVLAYPFAGGLNSPQFSSIELNGDGVSDLFVFDRVGSRVLTFVRTQPNTMNFDYAPEYASLFPDLNNWAFIRDYNQDGIPDIVASDDIPTVFGVQFYTGKMIDGQLTFELVQFTNGSFNVVFFENEQGSIQQLEVLGSDLPIIDDVDFDGDLDILDFGNSGVYLEYIENQSVELGFGSDSLIFKRQDECWGKFFEVGDFTASISLSDNPDDCFRNGVQGGVVSSRHVGSTCAVIDANNDQLMDLLIGDVSSNSIVYLENTGTQNNAWMTSVDQTFPSNDVPVSLFSFLAAFAVDVNDDGLQDLIISPNENLNTENIHVAHLYVDNGVVDSSDYRFQTSDFIVDDMIDVSQGSRPALVDYNADGLMDIVVGVFGRLDEFGFNQGQLNLFENVGSASDPAFALIDIDWLNFSQFGEQIFYLTPTFGDLDGDGDQDLLIGSQSGRMVYYDNTAGAGAALSFSNPVFDYMGIDVGGHANPAIVDIDGDGLMDLVIGEENGNRNADQSDICSHLSYFKNTGAPLSPSFNLDVESAPNISCFGEVRTDDINLSRRGYASPQFLELDGDLVLLVGGRRGKATLYGNINDQGQPFDLINGSLGLVDVGERSHPLLVDFNGDNLLELMMGNLAGGLVIYNTDVTLDQIVPTDDIVSPSSARLYPNPASEQLIIEADESYKSFSIYSINGILMSEGQLTNNSVIDISTFASGMYIIKMGDERNSLTRRFVKG